MEKKSGLLKVVTNLISIVLACIVLFKGTLPVWKMGKINSSGLFEILIVIILSAIPVIDYFLINKVSKQCKIDTWISIVSLFIISLFYMTSASSQIVLTQAIDGSTLRIIIMILTFMLILSGIIEAYYGYFKEKAPKYIDQERVDDGNDLDDQPMIDDSLTDEELESIGEKPKHMAKLGEDTSDLNEHKDDKKNNTSDDESEPEIITDKDENASGLSKNDLKYDEDDSSELDEPLGPVEEEKDDRVAPRKESTEVVESKTEDNEEKSNIDVNDQNEKDSSKSTEKDQKPKRKYKKKH